jgi:hypothetical protein
MYELEKHRHNNQASLLIIVDMVCKSSLKIWLHLFPFHCVLCLTLILGCSNRKHARMSTFHLHKWRLDYLVRSDYQPYSLLPYSDFIFSLMLIYLRPWRRNKLCYRAIFAISPSSLSWLCASSFSPRRCGTSKIPHCRRPCRRPRGVMRTPTSEAAHALGIQAPQQSSAAPTACPSRCLPPSKKHTRPSWPDT